MIAAIAHPVPRVAHDAGAVLIQNRQWTGVTGDHKIAAEKDVEFLKVQDVGFRVDPGYVENQVEVIIPIIHLGDVRLAQGVLDRKRMEMEHGAEPVFELVIRMALLGPLDIHPHQPAWIGDRLGDPARGPVGVEVTLAVAEYGLDDRATEVELCVCRRCRRWLCHGLPFAAAGTRAPVRDDKDA